MRAGVEIARLAKPEMVVTLEADGQYQPEEVERVMKPIADDEAHFA